jgi:hypothetical protein|tara:strand:- start:3052 stop:3312 length:261 start_codon:yes stop_codon:yes gene_type:complete
LTKVLLGKIKGRADDIAVFLREKIGDVVETDGGDLIVDLPDGTSSQSALLKTYLKRFLYLNDLRSDHRVLVNKDEIEIVELEKNEE